MMVGRSPEECRLFLYNLPQSVLLGPTAKSSFQKFLEALKMSIPPLVCSTPPPPDQCEDDKEHEDFDIQYNLSQEDDEANEYGYGNYNSYNNFPIIVESDKKIELPKSFPDELQITNDSLQSETPLGSTDHNTNYTTKVEESVIEDLDLKLDQVSINSGKISQTEDDEDQQDSSEESPHESSDKDSIQVMDHNLRNDGKETDEAFPEPLSKNDSQTNLLFENNSTLQKPNTTKNINTEELIQHHLHTEKIMQFEPEDDVHLILKDIPKIEDLSLENKSDDDFRNFDDFKFASSDINQTVSIVDNCDNPWGNEESNSNFKASFDNFDTKNYDINIQSSVEEQVNEVSDDDFGDFDDFKSSTIHVKTCDIEESSSQNNLFNVQSTDNYNQVVEKALCNIFEFEIPETESEFEGKLESSLCEVWGHLTEVESRQPYMINWNNSLGQKSLLKALCIDSRNILFGPKWTHNMPKYAANLCAAPLQPQKPVSSNVSQSESLNSEKSGAKSADGWVDPFTSEGTESCKSESSKDVAPPRSTDLSVFKTASAKPEEIYSSTLNVQPLRQINLPDTHIFTPTDSEIPRSKTIHYDSDSTVLKPQTMKPPTDDNTDDEYSDFQDFKSSVINLNRISEPKSIKIQETGVAVAGLNPVNVTCATHETSILQPIKIEPITPTLNWPDPGEIKTEFEDFTDFVSNTWPTEKAVPLTNQTSENIRIEWPTEILHTSLDIESTEMNKFVDLSSSNAFSKDASQTHKEITTSDNKNEDEFETFQSASPESLTKQDHKSDPNIPYQTEIIYNTVSSQSKTVKSDIDIVFPNFNKSNSSNIAITQPQMSQNREVHIPNRLNTKIEESRHSIMSPQSHLPASQSFQVLQPTPAGSALTAQKPATTQILQPLSLEGYSQINWPNPGSIDLQDLSRFNPVETLPSLKGEQNGGSSKTASPAHSQISRVSDDDWGDFVSIKPKQQSSLAKVQSQFADDDEWTDFVSSPAVQPQNGLNTISLNVHTNLNVQKSVNSSKYKIGKNSLPLDVSINYVTPKTNHHTVYSDRRFQNL